MTVLLTLAAFVIVAIVSPVMITALTTRARRQEIAQGNTRQDENNAITQRQLETVARLLVESNTDTQHRLDGIDAQAKRIHTLVNSDMTAARQSELDQTRTTLVMMRRVVALGEAAGVSAPEEDLAAIDATVARIGELEAILADRLQQMHEVEREAAEAEAKLNPVQ